MYSKIFGNSSSGGIRGTHYRPDLAHVYYVNNNGNSGIGVGQVLRLRVTPLEQVSVGSQLVTSSLPGTQINLDAGPIDVTWTIAASAPYTSGPSAVLPKLVRNGTGTQLYKYSAPTGGLAEIDPASLPLLSYSSNAILENGQGNNYYAAKLSSSNYAVFRVYKDPTDPTKTRFDWITYKLNSNPDIIGYGYDDPRDILLNDDLSVAYISAKDEFGADRVLAVPNMGTPSLPRYDVLGSSSQYAIDDPNQPLSDAQQLAFYNGNVYVVDSFGLWSINETAQTQTLVCAIPTGYGWVGLLIDSAGTAIITDTLGSIIKVDLTSASPSLTTISTLPGPTGFLTWTDESKTAFYTTVRDPDNKVCSVDLATNAFTLVLDLNTLTPALTDPWSVEVLSPSRLFLASDAELGSISLSIVSNALVLGIGFVPFDYIIQDSASLNRGRADTTPAVGYFYQVNKVPFGGNLNLLINHAKGYALGLRYYRITFKRLGTTATRLVTDLFTDLLWTQVGGVPKFYPSPVASTGPTPAAPTPANAFPIRKPSDLWYNPYLSAILQTSVADNGLNTITFDFFDQNGNLVAAETKSYVVLIDNNPCNAVLRLPRVGNPPPTTYPVPDCGCITYVSKNDHVEFDFSAWQLQGQGTYNLVFYRGNALPALTQSGVVGTSGIFQTKSTTNLPASPTFKIGHLTGDCTVAGIYVVLSVPPRVIDGYRWLSTANASQHFTLVPSTVPMSSPWVDPGG